jgi:hypothetical protein
LIIIVQPYNQYINLSINLFNLFNLKMFSFGVMRYMYSRVGMATIHSGIYKNKTKNIYLDMRYMKTMILEQDAIYENSQAKRFVMQLGNYNEGCNEGCIKNDNDINDTSSIIENSSSGNEYGLDKCNSGVRIASNPYCCNVCGNCSY